MDYNYSINRIINKSRHISSSRLMGEGYMVTDPPPPVYIQYCISTILQFDFYIII